MRKARSKIDNLGVKDLVHSLFEANAPYADIIAEVEKATGATVSDSALSRERDKWASAQSRLHEAEAQASVVMKVLQASPDVNFKEAGMALLWTKLLKRMAETDASFDGADMLELGHLLIKAVRLNQNTDALQIQRERLDLIKQKVATTAEKIDAIGRAKNLDDDTLKKIREEIYGLAPVG